VDIKLTKFDKDVHHGNSLCVRQVPRNKRVEDPHPPSSYSSFMRDRPVDIDEQTSLLEELGHFFKSPPSDFNMSDPSLSSLAYYPIKAAIAEWMVYIQIMNSYIKSYEYSFESVGRKIDSVRNEDVVELHRWRRRSKQSLHKLRVLKACVEHWKQERPDSQRSDLLLRDIQHVIDQIEQDRHSIDILASIATSMVQLMDARRSVVEAMSVRHLTYIALIFIPLAFVASLFSMTGDYAPGKSRFWIYWVTALPLLLLVLSLCRLPLNLEAGVKTAMVRIKRVSVDNLSSLIQTLKDQKAITASATSIPKGDV
jgi:CorA-like Mg2+ transporter protein